MYNNKSIGTLNVKINTEVEIKPLIKIRIWDAIKIRILGKQAIDKICDKIIEIIEKQYENKLD